MDQYDAANIDDREFSELSMADRMAINKVLERRDRDEARKQGRIPAAFLGGKIILYEHINQLIINCR